MKISFTFVCDCSVKTELIGKNNYATNSLNCFLIRSKMYRQFAVSFAFELTPGQWSCCTENRVSTFCKFQQHLFCNVVPGSLWAILGRIPLLFRTWSNKRPLSNTKSSRKYFHGFGICQAFIIVAFLSQEMSLNIDIKRILPVKVSGVCPKLLSRSLILSQSCNVSNPGKTFHSNSVGSPLIPSKSL